jgi:hypothetical protein
MKKKLFFIITISVLLILLVVGPVSYGVEQEPGVPHMTDFSKLTLKISSTKEEFAQLEPIPMIFNLRNETTRPIVGHSALELSSNFVKLFMIEDDGEPHEIQNLSPLTGNTAASSRPISPGENLESKQVSAFYLDKSFPRPGSYQIQAKLYDASLTNEIKSNLLTIRVHRPSGLTLKALKVIKSLGASSYFFSGVGFSSKEHELAALEDFTAKFGGTVYGDYAAFSLGELYFYDKNYEQASKQLSILEKKTDFVFREKARTYLEKISHENAISTETP